MVKSPVMFVVLVGSVLTTVFSFKDPGDWFGWAISAWLWLTVDLRQPGGGGRRGPRQGAGRHPAQGQDRHRRAPAGAAGVEEQVPGTELRIGDLVVCEAGDIIPGDGDVVEGVA